MATTRPDKITSAFRIWGLTNLLTLLLWFAFTSFTVWQERNEFASEMLTYYYVIGICISAVTIPVIPIVCKLLSIIEEESQLIVQGVVVLLAFCAVALLYALLINRMFDEAQTLNNLLTPFLVQTPFIIIATVLTLLIGRKRAVPKAG